MYSRSKSIRFECLFKCIQEVRVLIIFLFCFIDDSQEDFHSRLNGLVQSALLSHGVQVRNCNSASDVVVSEATDTQPQQHFLTTASQLADSLVSSSPSDKNSPAIVVEAVEVCD